MSFESLAGLLLPVESRRTAAVLEADERWSFDPRGVDADVVLWGRAPMPSGMAPSTLTRSAIAREWTLNRLSRWPPRPWQRSSVQRWPPAALGAVHGRERARAAMLGGALVQLHRDGPVVRVIDAAAAAAGAQAPLSRFSAGSGGSAIAQLSLKGGSPAILRIGWPGRPSDPRIAGDALEWLANAGIPAVPRQLAAGQTAGAGWTLESQLAGARGGSLTATLSLELSRFCARLPATSAPPTAFIDDLEQVALAFPEVAALIKTVSSFIRPVLRTMPAVTRHGDLWSGNLLLDRGRLAGVIDWDAWHPRGVPGTDLLHLLGMDQAVRHGRELGSVWLEAPWRSPEFESIASSYWSALDIWPDAATLQAVGIAWWAGYVAHSIGCDPGLIADCRWARLNVHDVLSALERMVL